MQSIHRHPGQRSALPAACLLAVAGAVLPAQAGDFSWTSGSYLAQGLPNPLLAGDRVVATGAAAKSLAGVIVNQRTMSWQTTAAATLSGGGTVLHNAGLFDLRADASIAWKASQGVNFGDTGLLRKSGGDGTSTTSARLSNSGTIEGQSRRKESRASLNADA